MDKEKKMDKENYILDLINVGKTKIIGYLPLVTIEREGYALKDLFQYARENEIEHYCFKDGEIPVFSGALYFVDIKKMEKFINFPEFDEVFEKGYFKHRFSDEISRDAYTIVDIIVNEHVSEEHYPKFYEMIALMFKNPLPEYQKRDAMKEVEDLIQKTQKNKITKKMNH